MKLNGRVVIGFSGGTREGMHIGECVGYMAQPTYIIETEFGQVSWAESLCREATAEETIAYWKDRALRREITGKSQ